MLQLLRLDRIAGRSSTLRGTVPYAGMDLGLDGRVALVTGASKGIGRAIAAELAAEGCSVAVSSRSRESIDEAASAIGATGFVWDSSEVDGAGRRCATSRARSGRSTCWCNTGGPPAGPTRSASAPSSGRRPTGRSCSGQMALVERAVPGMRRRGWGRVLNVASTSVREPIGALMLSNSHRAAMLAAFKTIARNVAADGVTLNTVLPGRIGTDRIYTLSGSQENAEAAAREQIPAQRLGTTEEMAAAAAFLCSARASYVTGQALAVDGGLLQSI